MELTEGYTDAIYHNIRIRFGWRDRLKILLSGWARAEIRIQCENPPGKVLGESRVDTPKLWRNPFRKPIGMEIVEIDQEVL